MTPAQLAASASREQAQARASAREWNAAQELADQAAGPGSVTWFDNGEPGGEYVATSCLAGLAGREWFGRTPDAARTRRDEAEALYLRHQAGTGGAA